MEDFHNKALQLITDLLNDAGKCLDEIDSADISHEQKDLVKSHIEKIVLSALFDARHSLEQDGVTPYFLLPYSTALVTLGQCHALVNPYQLAELTRFLYSKQAKAKADALHNKPGGSRDKQAAIRNAWASGKYTSRDICAEQECAALGMSFSAARKALRNTPDPT